MSTDRERFARAAEQFDARARVTTEPPEIRQLWATIAGSYRFLFEREDRLEAEERNRMKATGRQ